MTVNLNKYRESLIAAWQDVLSDKSDTDWALFGYEGQTNDLKFVSKGSGGIEEMTEDLNSGKIMYAYLKIQDPKTSLPKCVLINWQGEGANIVRKGTCANHVRDVGNFFSGAHMTINARNEEEIEPQLIIDKVSNSGSAYSFKAPRGERPESSKPVGTNYQRVNPIKEINSEERNKFWMRQEQEEKNRQVEERRKKDEERVKYETELQLREQEKHAQREALDIKRESAITEIKKAERDAEIISKQHLERESSHTEIEQEVMVNRSDVLRNQRKQEAQELIGKSTSTARSIFEQNTAVGQLSSRAPEKPVRQSIPKHNNENKVKEVAVVKTENVVQQRVELSENDDEEEQFSTIKRSPKVPSEDNNISEPFDINDREMVKNMTYLEQDTINLNKNNEDEGRIRIVTEQQVIDEVIYQDIEEDLGLQARALYDYQAADDTEITFDPGDVITHIDQIDEGWWQGLGPDGSFGLFPANYVEIIQ